MQKIWVALLAVSIVAVAFLYFGFQHSSQLALLPGYEYGWRNFKADSEIYGVIDFPPSPKKQDVILIFKSKEAILACGQAMKTKNNPEKVCDDGVVWFVKPGTVAKSLQTRYADVIQIETEDKPLHIKRKGVIPGEMFKIVSVKNPTETIKK